MSGVDDELEEIMAKVMARQDASPEEIARWEDEKRLREYRRKRELLERANAPKACLDVILDGKPRPTKAMLAARDYLRAQRGESPPLSLVLAGGNGCGKSTAATWLVSKLGGAFIYANAIGRLAGRRGGATPGESYEVLYAALLVVEDLGMEFVDEKGWFASCFDELVVRRIDNKRPLVITANMTLETFRKRYSGRVQDRLKGGMFIEFPDGSLR